MLVDREQGTRLVPALLHELENNTNKKLKQADLVIGWFPVAVPF